MSDHITTTLEFRLARETPRPLLDALTARAAGETPKADDLSQLPHSVAEYLRIEGADVESIRSVVVY